ncbi:restriction endonuclease subunit S [Streptococcus suis]|nr:restriction endonuclease subunit S [Streptococcus suis]
MSDVVRYKFSEFATITSSKRVHLSDYVEVGVPFYRSKEIIELANNQGISETLYISEEKYNEIKNKYPVPQIDDILITAVGTIGKIYLVKDVGFYFKDGNLIWVRDVNKEIININYLYYFLNSPIFQSNILKNNIGAVQKAITIDHLKSIELDLPTLEDQNNISNILKNIDQKIALNNQINEELEAMAKTLYDYWFVQFDFPNENGKPYKSSGGKMVYNDQLKREIPEGWGVKQLGEVSICHDSRRVPLSSKDRENKNGIIPYYGATGIMDYIDDFIFEGDYILMAEDGSVMTSEGKPILQRITGKTWVNNHAHVLEPTNEYSCKLLLLSLKDISVLQIKTGSIQMKITQENMNKILLPDIGRDLLSKINEVLLPIDEKQLKLLKQNQELTQLRDWLLPMLMNGQVKVD